MKNDEGKANELMIHETTKLRHLLFPNSLTKPKTKNNTTSKPENQLFRDYRGIHFSETIEESTSIESSRYIYIVFLFFSFLLTKGRAQTF